MPSTYTLISSNVLTSSAASVAFTAIPSTYTDLVIRASVRTDDTPEMISFDLKFNGAVASNASVTRLEGNGSTVVSNRSSAGTAVSLRDTNAAASTANSFTSFELYVPNYTVAAAKPSSVIVSAEQNATAATTTAHAVLFNSTSSITSISFNRGSENWVSGSSFYLYGISKS